MDMTGHKQTNPLIPPLAAAAALLAALCIGIGARLETGGPPGLPPEPFAHLLGRQAPDFALPGLDGETVSLASAREAEAWLLYFTDAGCGACEAAWPAVEEAAGVRTVSLDGLKGESSGVVFVSFSCRYSRQLMRAVLDEGPPDLGIPLLFIQREGDTGREPTREEADLQAELAARFPLVEDGGSTFDAYRSNRVPTTYLLDAEGRIERSGVGEPEGAELVKTLFENALKRKRT